MLDFRRQVGNSRFARRNVRVANQNFIVAPRKRVLLFPDRGGQFGNRCLVFGNCGIANDDFFIALRNDRFLPGNRRVANLDYMIAFADRPMRDVERGA
jgi:hypothetical protein